MKEIKEVKNAKELIGKTISQVIIPEECYEDLWIKFTDDSVVIFKINDITEGFGQTKTIIDINPWGISKTDDELVKLGFISQDEYRQAIRDKEEESRLYWEEQERKRDKEYEELERKKFEELKKKFG
jgi:hypothetical protein